MINLLNQNMKRYEIKQQQSRKLLNIYSQNSITRNLIIFLLVSLFTLTSSELLLDGVPFEFQLAGNVQYTPTSGGIKIQGYILRIGYTKHQWIGVKFMQLTTQSNYDILIFKRSTVSNNGAYQCSVAEYYAASGRPSHLMSDTINNMDKQVTTLSSSNHFQLQMYRTKSGTNGQDWTLKNQFTNICFFTSDKTFNKDTYQAQYQVCYGFVVKDYVSTWAGYQINSNAMIDGVNSKIYGGVEGPVLRLSLYIYRPSQTLTGSQVTIKIGDKISAQVGYDFQKCLTNKGDYFGNSTADLRKDIIYSGYNDNQCQVTLTSSSTIIHFSRLLNTHDDFDNVITQNTKFCFIIGSNQNCYQITPKVLYPIMEIESAIKIFGQMLRMQIILILIIMGMILIFIN